jgi:hypothetical protein
MVIPFSFGYAPTQIRDVEGNEQIEFLFSSMSSILLRLVRTVIPTDFTPTGIFLHHRAFMALNACFWGRSGKN